MKRCFALVLIFALLGSICSAEGLLPQLEEVYGVELPNLKSAIYRDADQEMTDEEETLKLIYQNITEEEYSAIDKYLSQAGCEVKESSVDGTEMTVALEKDGCAFSMAYDSESNVITMSYPKGTCLAEYDPYWIGNTLTFGTYDSYGVNGN